MTILQELKTALQRKSYEKFFARRNEHPYIFLFASDEKIASMQRWKLYVYSR